MREWSETTLLDAWTNPEPRRVEPSPSSDTQHLVMLVILIVAGALMFYQFNSLFGAAAALLAATLITFVTRVGNRSTRIFWLAIFSMLWVFVGRLLEFFGYGVWGLVFYVLAAAWILGVKR